MVQTNNIRIGLNKRYVHRRIGRITNIGNSKKVKSNRPHIKSKSNIQICPYHPI